MPRPKLKRTLNMSDRDTKRKAMAFVGTLDGFYDFNIEPKRNTRTLSQNAWYWGCIIPPLYDHLKDDLGWDVKDEEDAHDFLRGRFLGIRTIRNKNTGKVMQRKRVSTSSLSTEEFSEYCEKCRQFLAEKCNIEVPDPDPNWRNAECTSS